MCGGAIGVLPQTSVSRRKQAFTPGRSGGRGAKRCSIVNENISISDLDSDQYLKFEAERTRPSADLLARVPLAEARRCIDIGCGPGNSTELILGRFPGAIVTGLDNSPGMLSKARERLGGLTFEEADLTTWWPDQRFDLIFANDVLQWLPDPQRILLIRLGYS
jgi:trans-aconitate 2-methyltransferase